MIRPEPGDALPSLVTLDQGSVALAAAWSFGAMVLVASGIRRTAQGAAAAARQLQEPEIERSSPR